MGHEYGDALFVQIEWLQFSIKGLYDGVEGLCLNELIVPAVFCGIFDGVSFCVKAPEE